MHILGVGKAFDVDLVKCVILIIVGIRQLQVLVDHGGGALAGGREQPHRAAVHIDRAVERVLLAVAGQLKAQVLLNGHIVDQVQGAAAGDADGTHPAVVGSFIFVEVVLHHGAVL